MASDSEVIILYKKIGETPLECLRRLREAGVKYKAANMTYLGRLDPMAEGVLPVLIGNTKNKEKYLALDKTYEFEVLWGFESDTYDILGLVSFSSPGFLSSVSERISSSKSGLLATIKKMKTQSYPPYSSRTVGGKGLWQWAREGKMEEIKIPERSIKIFSIDHIHTRWVSGGEVLKNVLEKVSLVKGDFRQEEIIASWHKAMQGRENEQFLITKFVADVSTGTYIRSLAHQMGKISTTSAIAYSIKRTRVGAYTINDAVDF